MSRNTTNEHRRRLLGDLVAGAVVAAMSSLSISPAWSGECIYALGDSLTAAYVPALKKTLPNTEIFNGGLGGQDAIAISARAGATATNVLVVLSPEGLPKIVSASPNILRFGGTESSQDGRLGETYGRLRWSKADGYAFEPLESSSPPPIGKVPFYVDRSRIANCTLLLWAGRNGYRNTRATLDAIQSVMTLWRAAGRPAYVLSILNGEGEGKGTRAYQQIIDLNNAIQKLFGDEYVNVRSWLVEHASDALTTSLSPSSRSEISQDIVPNDLRSDHIHLNAAANSLLADFLAQRVLRSLQEVPK